MSTCQHCLGTKKCRFAKLRDNGKRGDDKVMWWNCLICGESEPFSVLSSELVGRPGCRVCKGPKAETIVVPISEVESR